MLAALALLAGSAACATSTTVIEKTEVHAVRLAVLPRTRAERSGFTETSRYADVVAFLDSLKLAGAPVVFGSIGKTSEGRDIPYVLASRPLVHSAEEARATGKPIVYVQGNIHAGEVEGKEALQALVRDLAFARESNVLDSVILIAVPIYNADGNERVGPQEKQRSEQNGPELVGQRANAQGLDLNRDYVKAEAPETRASLAMFNAWDPDVFVDLHTTDGSFHGYALTYAPSLHPSAQLGDYTRELLSEVRSRMRARHHYETFDYGNFADARGEEVSTDTVHSGWFTYDHRPRFGTNYYGLRNRIGILSEAFSHDPFERRVKSTYAFVGEVLSLVAERGAEIRRREAADPALSDFQWGVRDRQRPMLALRSALPKSGQSQLVSFEVLASTGDSTRTQAGVPRGIRRTGELRARTMPVLDRFAATREEMIPTGYLVRRSDTTTTAALRRHGIVAEPMTSDFQLDAIELFTVDSVIRQPRVFQGHHEARLAGSWTRREGSLNSTDWYRVSTRQNLGRLVMVLLDPGSDDGFATWDILDRPISVGPYPVARNWWGMYHDPPVPHP